MKIRTGAFLSIMMFLQYFVWGSWYVTMGTFMTKYLVSTGIQIGAAYSALAIATMISPFFVGMIADRYFAAQRVMGFLHLVGGMLLFLASAIPLFCIRKYGTQRLDALCRYHTARCLL